MRRQAIFILTIALVLAAVLTASAKPKPTPTPTPAASPSAEASPAASPEASPSPEASVAPPPGSGGDRDALLSEALASMSKIQSMVEFFYMNTGIYPPSLGDLEQSFNDGAPRDAKKVTLPVDPATSKPFLYEVNGDGASYTLKAPLPEKYGLKKLQIGSVDWGWMRMYPEHVKQQKLAEACARNIQGLAGAVDQFARDNKNALPDSLESLLGKYGLKDLKKVPVCPACSKPYVYTRSARGYEISCPDPKSHDMEILKYSSTEGFKHR